jgi:hypothetical protein
MSRAQLTPNIPAASTKDEPWEVAAGLGEYDALALSGTGSSRNIVMIAPSAIAGDETGAGPCSLGQGIGLHRGMTASAMGFVQEHSGSTTTEKQMDSAITSQPQGEFRVVLWDSYPRDRSG